MGWQISSITSICPQPVGVLAAKTFRGGEREEFFVFSQKQLRTARVTRRTVYCTSWDV